MALFPYEPSRGNDYVPAGGRARRVMEPLGIDAGGADANPLARHPLQPKRVCGPLGSGQEQVGVIEDLTAVAARAPTPVCLEERHRLPNGLHQSESVNAPPLGRL